ncbi:MAG: hypothetical protein JSV77_11520 [Dehalococcoidales bacterium]|nr:MAG: hypothetical protein JSV77_11520 [Dehalococcoidales bacterium]
MSRQIKITVGEIEVDAWLNDTGTATGVFEVLPITTTINMWGDEIYFPIPVQRDEENATENVAVGDIAYWPQGSAMCIFLGKTPVSRVDEPRPISPVNVIGHIDSAAELLGKVRQGDTITVRK